MLRPPKWMYFFLHSCIPVVYESFDKYVSAEVLDMDKREETDELLCEAKHANEKKVTFVKFPPVLHLHLMRFYFIRKSGRSQKCNDRWVLSGSFCVYLFLFILLLNYFCVI